MMANQKRLTTEQEERKTRIWQFVLENVNFFCDPKPEGLGFPRPGMVPGHYLERPDEWQLDKVRVLQLKRDKQVRDEAVSASTASAGMAPETRRLLDSIRSLHAHGLAPEAIADQLGVSVTGIRNVLRLGQQAYDPRAHGPTQLPELVAFRESWGRKVSWHGGHTNGNENENENGKGHKNGAL